MTREELKAKLDELGIEYKVSATKAELEALLPVEATMEAPTEESVELPLTEAPMEEPVSEEVIPEPAVEPVEMPEEPALEPVELAELMPEAPVEVSAVSSAIVLPSVDEDVEELGKVGGVAVLTLERSYLNPSNGRKYTKLTLVDGTTQLLTDEELKLCVKY